MITPHSYRAGLAEMLLLATLTAAAALPGSGSQTMGVETSGGSVARAERVLAAQVVAHRLPGVPHSGLRVSSLGSRHPVKLSRPLALDYNEADRIAGWIASLQLLLHYRMGDTIDTMSLAEVTQAEAALRPLAFAIDRRWFAVEYVDLHYSGRKAMSKPDSVRDLVVQTGCRFMSRVAVMSANPGSCADDSEGAVMIARQ